MNMNLRTLASIASAACCLATTICAQTPDAPAPAGQTPATPVSPVKDVFPRFSVVGEWRVTHPDWTDVVTLHEDGSLITTRQRTTGRWMLTGDKGTPILVFQWDLFGTTSLGMVSLDHFRGQARNGRFIDMQRGNKAGDEQTPQPGK